MKWLSKWIYQQWQKGQYGSSEIAVAQEVPRGRSIGGGHIRSDGMNFTVYRADSGFVIEHTVYDKKTDRNNNSLYIVTEEQNLGEQLGKIIVVESLRS